MSSLADLPELVGFFSYSREDDDGSDGALSALRARIQHELRAQLGRSFKTFRLWQDKEAIAPGTLWEGEIKTAIEQSVFFIPIITPTVVKSPYCRFELDAFLAREQALGRSDLVFPILYIRVPSLEDSAQRRGDPVLSLISKRQYVDWREFRHRDVNSTEMKEKIERFCESIVKALHAPWLSPQERESKEAAEAHERAERERRVQEAEAKRRAEEASKREEAERRRRAEGERTVEEARRDAHGERRAEQERALARATGLGDETAGPERDVRIGQSPRPWRRIGTGAAAIALLMTAWLGLYYMGVPLWVPWAQPGRSDAEIQRQAALRADQERKRAEEEAKANAEAEAKRNAQEAALKAEEERKRAEAEARHDPALAVKPGSGQSFRDRLADGQPCPTCPEMVVVPAGNFLMGSSEKEKGRSDDEGPQHKVTIAKPLAIGKFSVTRGEFAAFVRETDYKTNGGCTVWSGSDWKSQPDRSWRSPGFDQDDRHPVVCVNWNDLKAFVARLSTKTGKPYRLPTEAEWEYAARAGTATRYSFGDNEAELPQYAWYKTNSGGQTHPVGEKKPNAFGLFDAHGNAWTWCEDNWHPNYQGAPNDGSVWLGGDASFRVLRGGSWIGDPRSALRTRIESQRLDNDVGFRVVRTLLSPPP
jgi:formylglycine-generating enzyme required for sulfatase activity